ncbi:hypothetical protein [Rhodospirillaceae bacterium SYSU D60014]|uniref:hypothetical protein n=1 Tax=Virgifigura deserti TaxID=2268457 RepID=UPI000E666A7A
MKQIIGAIFILLALNAPALAEGSYQDGDELRLVRLIYVYVADKVKDGCLPRPESLKAEAELILRRSGIPLTQAPQQVSAGAGYGLSITPLGYAMGEPLNNLCVARLSVRLYRYAETPEGHYAYVLAYDQGAVMNQPKPDLQSVLREGISTVVTDIANEILKAQGH